MLQEGNASALRYKDIISNFENVLCHVAKKQESQGQSQFPITLGINAFRGFLDEFMHQYVPAEKKVSNGRELNLAATFASQPVAG